MGDGKLEQATGPEAEHRTPTWKMVVVWVFVLGVLLAVGLWGMYRCMYWLARVVSAGSD